MQITGAVILSLITLKKRTQFLRLRGGARWATRAFVIETKPRTGLVSVAAPAKTRGASGLGVAGLGAPELGAPAQHDAPEQVSRTELVHSSDAGTLPTRATQPEPPRFGFTITKRIGNAVTRNLIRRRLKEIMRALAPTHAKAGYDYVLIARKDIVTCTFAQLTRELKTALTRIHKQGSGKPRRNQPKRSSGQHSRPRNQRS